MHKRIPVTRAVTKKTDWNSRILNITLAKVNDAYLLLQLFHLKSTSTLFFFNTAMSSIAIQISRLFLFLLFSRFFKRLLHLGMISKFTILLDSSGQHFRLVFNKKILRTSEQNLNW
jgi:hypothetical protein